MNELHKPLSAIFVPALQSVVSGLFSGLFTGLLSALAGYYAPAQLGLIVGAGVSLLSWLSLLSRWGRLTAFQITGDLVDYSEQPQPAPAPLRLEVIQEEGRLEQWAELEARPEQLNALARGLLRGQSFSEDSWTGAGRPFSRSQFRQLRDIFISRGWLSWRDMEARSQGLQLTHAGRSVIKYLSDIPLPPALQSGSRQN